MPDLEILSKNLQGAKQEPKAAEQVTISRHYLGLQRLSNLLKFFEMLIPNLKMFCNGDKCY